MTNKFLVFSPIALTLALAVPAFAQTTASAPKTPSSAAAIACIGAAVGVRESALGSGISTHNGAVSAAYSARATALQQAYTGSTASEVRTAVKAAWKTFAASLKSAGKAWRSTRASAWSTFKTAAKACKAPATVSDAANVSSEATGE